MAPEGLDKGRAEGLLEGKKETARKLKGFGIPIKQISEATGLTPEDIQSL